MQQNHQKSVQTLVDGAISWVHGHSLNHGRWRKFGISIMCIPKRVNKFIVGGNKSDSKEQG